MGSCGEDFFALIIIELYYNVAGVGHREGLGARDLCARSRRQPIFGMWGAKVTKRPRR